MVSAIDTAAGALGLNQGAKGAALREYLKNGGVNLDPATAAWCAAFVNATLQQTGVKGTGNYGAASFMKFGEPVQQPQRGDIVITSRDGPTGVPSHVGFYDSDGPGGGVRILGGNQGGGQVTVAEFPRAQLVGFRRAPAGAPPAPAMPAPTPQPSPLQQAAEGVVAGDLADLYKLDSPSVQQAEVAPKMRPNPEPLAPKQTQTIPGAFVDLFAGMDLENGRNQRAAADKRRRQALFG